MTYHPVTKPRHYHGASGLQAIDVVEAWGLGENHYLATALCYVIRSERKGGTEDLAKARWYLERELARVPDKRKRARTNPHITTALVIEDFGLTSNLGNAVTAIYCAAVWEQGRNIREQIEAAIGWLADEIARKSSRTAPVIVDEEICA